jgi:N-acetylmuramoyl-L-alanine amidase
VVLCFLLIVSCIWTGQAVSSYDDISGEIVIPKTQPIVVDKIETVKVYVDGGVLRSSWNDIFSRIICGEHDNEDEEDSSFHLFTVVTSVECSRMAERTVLKVNCTGEIDYDAYLLKDPYRVVLDMKDAMIRESIPNLEVNDGIVKRVRVSQNAQDTVRIVADLDKPVGYQVSSVLEGDLGLEVVFNHHIDDINFEHTVAGGRLNIISSGELEYTSMLLFDPARIVLDARPATLEYPLTVDGDVGEWVKSIRASQYDGDTVRIVIDLVKPVSYRILGTPWTSWKLSVDLASMTSAVHYASETDRTKVSIPLVDAATHTARYFSNPDRIVVDLPGFVVGADENILPVNDGIVDRVRIGQFEPETARVVIDLVNRSSYDIRENKERNGLVVEVFRPTLLGKVIAIDPGHGGVEPGAVGPTGLLEKSVNLDIALRLNRMLLEAGARTIMTRTDDSYVFIPDRAEIANSDGADILVSIHANAAKKNYASGTETFYYPGRLQASVLAESIQSSLLAGIGLENRRAKPGDYLVLRLTTMPSVLVEVAFVSNEREERLLADPSFRQTAAEAIFQGIVNFFAMYR